MIKYTTAVLCFLFSFAVHALEIQPGVFQGTVQEIQQAEKKFDSTHQTWVGFLPGNDEHDPLHKVKRRSTLIIHHEDPKADKHSVIVWGHGMGGFHKFAQNMYPQLQELAKRGKSFTLIEPEMPWSCNVSHIDGRPAWTQKGSFKLLVDSALAKFPVPTGKQMVLVVGGHSRGGKFIRDAAIRGGLCGMNPSWILWSDATYSRWFDSAWNACLKNAADKVEVFYLRGTETGAFVRRLRNDQHFDFVHLHPLSLPWYHGKVGDNVLLLSEFLK